jgi:hypothetical protein
VVAIKITPGKAFDIYALEQNGRRELLDFLIELKGSSKKDFDRLTSLFDRTADIGRIRNEYMFKRLTSDIYEFKTFTGVRVLCFFDGRNIVILTNGFRKKKKYDDEIGRAAHLRANYLNAKINGCLTYREEIL